MPALDPAIWGPHFWFVLHTLAISYPHHPNAVTKKKYYEFIQNIPLFIPVESIGSSFIKILDEYPVSSYLDSRDSLIRWMHFIHNKVNEKMEKPKITMNEFYQNYYEAYKPKHVKLKQDYKWRERLLYLLIIIIFIALTIWLYR